MSNFVTYILCACFIIFSIKTGSAQSCTGSLGTPVINVNFGSGPNPGPALPVARTASRYTATLCAEGDSYTLASSINNCYNGTWLDIQQDHTGDPDGYMMLINPDSSTLYMDTIPLCGGTTYEFAAFLLNVTNLAACGGVNGNTLPNITLLIETIGGIGLDSLSTGDIGITADPLNPSWNRYAFFFTLPEMYSDVVMRIRNNRGPGGCGNDLAMDDITIKPCGLTLGASFAGVNPDPDTLHFCESDNKTITLNGNVLSGFEKTVLQWQESSDSGKTWTDIVNASTLQLTKTYAAAARLQYRITGSAGVNIASINCRTVSNILNVLVDAVPVPQAANTSPVCVGSPISFMAKTGDHYEWTGPAGFTESGPSPFIAAAALNNNGKYYVVATTRGGCIKQDSTAVIVSDFPVANAGRDTGICIGSSVNLQATGGLTYTWSPSTGLSSTTIANPVASPAISVNYTVTVRNQYNCTAQDNIFIVVNTLPVVNAGADIFICKGSTTNLQASGGVNYIWTPSTGLSDAAIANPVASPVTTTAYTVKVTNEFNCTVSGNILVKVFEKPVANAGPDKTIIAGQSTTLRGTATSDTASWFWTPAQFINNPALLTPVVNPIRDMTYTLHVPSGNNCGTATDDVLVRVNKTISVPNAFSPNGDGINDVWNIDPLETYPESETQVFNRYGQAVFYSKGYSKPWDGRFNGKPLPAGAYYYRIDRKNALPLLSGWLMLIR